MCIEFTELENGNLRLSVFENEYDNLQDIIDNNNLGDMAKLLEATESYWTNGWGVLDLGHLWQLSEAPVIVEECTIEEDGSITLYGKSWYQNDYATRSAVETILEQGYIDFVFWQEFKGENFETIYE